MRVLQDGLVTDGIILMWIGGGEACLQWKMMTLSLKHNLSHIECELNTYDTCSLHVKPVEWGHAAVPRPPCAHTSHLSALQHCDDASCKCPLKCIMCCVLQQYPNM